MSTPAIAPSADLLRPATLPAVDPARLRQTAEAFEASFLAQMLKPMFDGLSSEAPFGGGHGEETWRGFLVEAMAGQMARSGGIGLADHVMAEMIRLQGADA